MKNRKSFLALLALLALVLAGCSRKQVLHVYTWADYFSPEVIARFEKENDCIVKQDIFDSNEMMFAKLQAGGTGYDIIVPTHYFIGKMASEGMIVKLDKSRLPNLKHLDPEIVALMNPMVLEYSVPYFMSYTGLGYNKERLPDFDPSWSVFMREDLAGRMTLLDDYTEVLGALGRYLGYTAAEMDDPVDGDARMEEVVKLGLEWRKNVIKFENEQYKNGLSAGEFLVVMGYFSDLAQVVDEDPDTLAFVMPKEGCHMSCDTLVIPTSAPNPDLAYKLINFLHEPENAAQNIKDIHTYCPNVDGVKLLPQELIDSGNFIIPKEVLAKSEFMPELSPEQEARHLKYWNRIKAGK